ncbi:hypothetical protein C8F04DRAFT_1396277 [Mycena alexandri]|uniref:Transposase n=1 Tax=Mycena alexandri TaxID=1745969 RepID=A0AAD6WZ99_9AGAR|nr:hypothetical protein C8F04DRAFT_1396277 [Mycena alexandri]
MPARQRLPTIPAPNALFTSATSTNSQRGSYFVPPTDTMKAVVRKALRATKKSKKEEILKSNGLHGIPHFLWDYRFSDPYAAYSYGTLHSDDLGKWGHHLWPLLLEVLEERGCKGAFAENMREFSWWPGLKHFKEVTTIHFADGQASYDILKCVLPCIVQLMPLNDPLVHCIRSYQRYRLMSGMHCMPMRRLDRLKELIKDYEHWCSRMSEKYGKDFGFFKQHATSHIIADICTKGTSNHGSTRPGEGFQQEAAQAYNRTNFENVTPQMDRIDENQEALARIRMAVDRYDDRRKEDEQEDDMELDETASPGRRAMGMREKEPDLMLRDFIAEHYPADQVTYEECIQIRPYKYAHITYQSLEDWRGVRDIVRCNPSFHGHTRHDSVLVNSDAPGMSFARLYALLRCKLENGRQIDLALVREFKPNKWKPKPRWAGCQLHEEVKGYFLLLMDYVIRGALLNPVPGKGKENLHFFVDTVDADMFLRADQN